MKAEIKTKLQAALKSICTKELHITPLYIAVHEDGALIKANTGHEYFIDGSRWDSAEEFKHSLADIYYQHKANNTH